MKVCTPEQMRSIDKGASEKFGIPSVVLMENAANACVEEIRRYESFVVICGKGNNGGDGLAIARRLIIMGKKVSIYLAGGTDFAGDALINYNILKAMGAEMLTEFSTLRADVKAAECVVDAIFGTGFSGRTDGKFTDIIHCINENARFVLAVDVPSGINSANGYADVAVRADETVTFAAYKKGMLLFPAADFVGKVKLCDISIPKELTENISVDIFEENDAKRFMPHRCANSHKGDYGKILVIGGCRKMKGAVELACRAALRTGAGLVTACVPEDTPPVVSAEIMTDPVCFCRDADKIAESVNDYDAVLFGNGIGRGKEILPLLEKILKKSKVPTVIDADGLFALAQKPEIAFGKNVILTPHTMEAARLLKTTPEEIEKNRFEMSERLAKMYGATLVLKGRHSIITAPDGRQRVNLFGNSGMATAGSGDVLAGMTVALTALCDPFDALSLAVYLHARAGDYAANELCETSLIAGDIINAIPHILPVEK